ncbi:MAG: LysM peptidoglycan-binding domain-containing protein [Saprospiraceae bacterium]|nr:LysM peptidoglycan-binding domain-containing protein [Saprospiraceae bacterium]
MRLRYLWISLFMLLNVAVTMAQEGNDGFIEFPMLGGKKIAKPTQRKSLLSNTDSLFLKVEHGQKILMHKVKKGESAYAIKNYYSISLQDLYHMNPKVQSYGLKIGQELKIPIISRVLKRYKPRVDTAFLPVYYKVQPSETLYRIAKVYFGLPIEVLKNRNNLLSNVLYKDQILHVAWFPKTGVSDTLKGVMGLTGILGKTSAMHQKRYESLSLDKEEITQEGVACWLKGTDFTDKASLSVMHNQMPTGSILRIENPMNGRILYAKVVGTIPETSLAEGSTVMLSPNVAYGLGAVDARFFVRVYYLK